eukprot:GEMP01004164.1.p1 GENE.GEMP01004164.1~~GEMP01004164.1.p1  ORF type:complete len:958 (+),score=81.04 GEMP01004164.1:227-3100(+)
MAVVNTCLATGLAWCSGSTTIAECCSIVTTERLDEQCLFSTLEQKDWTAVCCKDVPGVTCRGQNCQWYKPKICCAGGNGLFLPFLGPSETEWNRGLKIILYILGLGWLFMGVTAAADIFMQGVEVITSTQRIVIVVINNEKHKVKVHMWNDTVANLTLMALGSSAPEILLSIIELFVNEYHAGVLGPSTIVGSASFNLFIISAICISSIPDGEIRYIRDMDVFCITAFFSVFAYIWVVFILEFTSPDRVTIVEAALTFLYSILLICLAYLADIGKISYFGKPDNKYVTPDDRQFLEDGSIDEEPADGAVEAQLKIKKAIPSRRPPTEHESDFFDRAMTQNLVDGDQAMMKNPETKSEFAPMIKQFKLVYGEISDHEMTLLLIAWMKEGSEPKKSRAIYRQEATQKMFGGGKLNDKAHMKREPSMNLQSAPETHVAPVQEEVPNEVEVPPRVEDPLICCVSFHSPYYSVNECDEFVHPKIFRTGPSQCEVKIPYKTIDDTAFAVKDYVAQDTVLTLAPGEMEKEISVNIIDNDTHEQHRQFFVRLGEPTCSDNTECVIGEVEETRVTIIDDDDPGVLSFDCQEITVEKNVAFVTVTVIREYGCSAEVCCNYHTYPQTATPERDYVTSKGELRFLKNEIHKNISIELLETQERRRTSTFRIILSKPQGGVTFCNYAGERVSDEIKTIVVLRPSCPTGEDTPVDSERLSWRQTYLEQFRETIYTNGSPEEAKKASWPDFILHVATLPWKLLLATTPPVEFYGGWLRFLTSLLFIGLFTALINDMASLVGCALTIPDAVTAITFVALGTSLPDTFASMMAAQSDTHADASIGNITGSNSVNVFLGLGISWSIGAVYWELTDDPTITQQWLSRYTGKVHADVIKSGGFAVPSGSLSLNVTAFCVGAFCTFILLRWRRGKFGGELGGPKKYQHLSSIFLITIWVCYVTFASVTSVIDDNRQNT